MYTLWQIQCYNCNVKDVTNAIWPINAIWWMQCDYCNEAISMWQMQCAMWQMNCDKFNITNVSWKLQCDSAMGQI